MAWAWRLDKAQPDLKETPSGKETDGQGANGTTVSWSSVLAKSARALEVRLQHPDQDDSTLRWDAITTITEVEGATRFTLRLQVGATIHKLQPWHISLRAPSIVLGMMQAPLLAYAGNMELHAAPRHIEEKEVTEFLENRLCVEGRALPIVVAGSVVDARFIEGLSRGLAGLVQIVHMKDRQADVDLEATLKKSGYTIPDGGIRLFWPDFGREGRRQRHPYWTAAQLRAGKRRGQSVISQLVGLVAPVSTGRVPVDTAFLKVRTEWLRGRIEAQRARDEATRQRARRQRQIAQRARREAREVSDGEEVKRLQEQLADAEANIALLEQERDDARVEAKAAEEKELQMLQEATDYSEQLEAIKSENEDLHKNIRTLSEFHDLEEEVGSSDEDIPDELEAWDDIAEHLDDLEGPGFCFTDQARACANGKNRYPNPNAIWDSLRMLEKVGRAYNEMGAELGVRFDKFAIDQTGIEIALQDHSYDDSWFEFDDRWFQRIPHVKVDDAKSPNEVGRIYFALDSVEKRVIVDWFGTKPDRPYAKRTS